MAANLTPEQIAYLRKYFAENGATRQTQFGNGEAGPTYNTETNFATPTGGGKYQAIGNGEFAQDLGNNQYAFYDSNGNYTTTKTISPDMMTQMMPYIVGAGLGGIALFGGAAGAAEGAGLTELGVPGSSVGSGEVAATGLLEPGAAEAAGGAAAGGAAKAAGAGGGGLLSAAGKAGSLLLGAAAGAKPTTKSETIQSKTDPRLDPYIYGDQGILSQAQKWQQANQTGLNPQMLEGLNMQYNVNANPENWGAYQQMARLGSGLMSSPIAGNPFTNSGAKNLGFSNQNAGMATPNASPYKQPTYTK